MNSTGENNFVETLEYRRFKEFCDACSRYCYIGLCYGSPGVGKTLSAQHYSRWNQIQGLKLRDIPDDRVQELAQLDVVLYTTPVVNTPREIERDIPKLRELLRHFRQEPIRREETRMLKQIQKRDAEHQDSFFTDYDWFSEKLPKLKPTFGQVCRRYQCAFRKKPFLEANCLPENLPLRLRSLPILSVGAAHRCHPPQPRKYDEKTSHNTNQEPLAILYGDSVVAHIPSAVSNSDSPTHAAHRRSDARHRR